MKRTSKHYLLAIDHTVLFKTPYGYARTKLYNKAILTENTCFSSLVIDELLSVYGGGSSVLFLGTAENDNKAEQRHLFISNHLATVHKIPLDIPQGLINETEQQIYTTETRI